MFDRFTDEARQVIVDAHEVARELRSGSIGTGELLVALLDHAAADVWLAEPLGALGVGATDLAAGVRQAILAGDGLDAPALASLGIDLAAVRRKADAVFGKGALGSARGRAVGGHVPFTAGAKQSLELALREASALRSGAIDVRHLMLGVLDGKDGTARELLGQALLTSGEAGVTDPDQRVDALRRLLTQLRPAG